jgi:hypothetical protein
MIRHSLSPTILLSEAEAIPDLRARVPRVRTGAEIVIADDASLGVVLRVFSETDTKPL